MKTFFALSIVFLICSVANADTYSVTLNDADSASVEDAIADQYNFTGTICEEQTGNETPDSMTLNCVPITKKQYVEKIFQDFLMIRAENYQDKVVAEAAVAEAKIKRMKNKAKIRKVV